MDMADARETTHEGQARSTEDSHWCRAPSGAEPGPSGIGKVALIAAVVALLIGAALGFTMSTVGLR
jgi:hypothetical protein